ncbi:hypothetical protein BCR44DRAFT_167368, partial [Catenaria anguillulae PL171]
MRLTVCWKLFAGCVVLSFGGRCEQPPRCACGVGGQEGSSPVCTIYDDNGVLCCPIPLLSPLPSDLQANRHSFIHRPPLWHRRAFLGRQQHSCSCGPNATSHPKYCCSNRCSCSASTSQDDAGQSTR